MKMHLLELKPTYVMHCLPQWNYGKDIMGFEILALHTRCYKGLLIYNKVHGISTMMKHVELERASLL
jgi:hypothetical protein